MSAPDPPAPINTDDVMIRLLRAAGPRPSVPAIREARVRAAVYAEWHVRRRRRSYRRRLVLASLGVPAAAALIVVVAKMSVATRPSAVAHEPVAVVERVDGPPQRGNDPSAIHLTVTKTVFAGEWIATDAQSRVALRFSDGTSVRLDAGSRARPLGRRVLELSAGAVYVDTGSEAGGFEIRTALATAMDIGTQFEVRLVGTALRLRVRSGLVELRDATRSVSGREGTEVTLSGGRADTRKIATHGAQWDWIDSVAPALEIDGKSLSAVLQRVAHEYGWLIRYDDPALARETSAVIVHGSASGLTPREALEVAIAASGLRHRIEDGTLIVLRGADAK